MTLLVFPHQLFENHPGFKLAPNLVVLVEDSLFFGDDHHPLKFHKQKLWLHRASMKRYELHLRERGMKTLYLDYVPGPDSLKRQLLEIQRTSKSASEEWIVAEPDDFPAKKTRQAILPSTQCEVYVRFESGVLESACRQSNVSSWKESLVHG